MCEVNLKKELAILTLWTVFKSQKYLIQSKLLPRLPSQLFSLIYIQGPTFMDLLQLF